MLFVGIDPGLRFTGLCCREGRHVQAHLTQIKSSGDVLSSLDHLGDHFQKWVHKNIGGTSQVVWGFERQLPQGSVNGWLMLVIQMMLFQKILEAHRDPDQVAMVAPYPNQLKAYVKKTFKKDTDTSGKLVGAYKSVTKTKKRVSSHMADAYFLSRLAEDVVRGNHSFYQARVKPALTPWKLLRGT